MATKYNIVDVFWNAKAVIDINMEFIFQLFDVRSLLKYPYFYELLLFLDIYNIIFSRWSGCRDLNSGPPHPKWGALAKLRYSPKMVEGKGFEPL